MRTVPPVDHTGFAALLRALAHEGARTLVAGGLARKIHGEIEASWDQTVWYGADEENARRVYRALARVGAPLDGVEVPDLADVDYEFRFGEGPSEVVLVGSLDGVTFADAWSEKLETRWRDVPIYVLGIDALRAYERATASLP